MTTPYPIDDAASIAVMRERARELGVGLPAELVERAAIVISELGHNQVRYGRLGELGVYRAGDVGLDILATDTGDGLADPVKAFSGAAPSKMGLGIGLAGVRRACAALCLDNRHRQGLRILARLRVEGAPREPEWVILGRPHPDEHESGDDAAVVDLGNGDWMAIMADGLGHGPKARLAAVAAIRTATLHADDGPVRILERCDAALHGTRGAAIAVARRRGDEVYVSIAGNIRVSLLRHDAATRVPSVPRVIGSRRGRTLREVALPVAGATLLMTTDGIHERGLPRSRPTPGWPLALAADLIARHGREADDATVLALR